MFFFYGSGYIYRRTILTYNYLTINTKNGNEGGKIH